MMSSAKGLAAEVALPWCGKWMKQEMSQDFWDIAYTGHGQVKFDGGIHLSPKTAVAQDQTHAALALLKRKPKSNRYAVRVKYENVRPLRMPASNPWETFWLFFDYTPDGKHKKTNYLIHKPNGMELGRAWHEVKQDFIATTTYPVAEVGRDYEMLLVREEKMVRAYIDGKLALESKNTTALERGGHIGLYTEDSQVWIKSLELCEPSGT